MIKYVRLRSFDLRGYFLAKSLLKIFFSVKIFESKEEYTRKINLNILRLSILISVNVICNLYCSRVVNLVVRL